MSTPLVHDRALPLALAAVQATAAPAAAAASSPSPRALPKAARERLANVKALLVDIDDTVIRANGGLHRKLNTGSLADVLLRAGIELAGLTPQEAARRIQRVKREIQWWHWSDFIVELDLNPKAFWEYAYEIERHYIEATGPEILPALHRLRAGGVLLYVASNNPSSGILHKLRLAGIAHVNGCTLFNQLLGATELHAMKWEPIYWKKALAHIGLDGAEVAVVGDSVNDDYAVPHAAGIGCSFLIDREQDLSAEDQDCLIHVRSFDDVANLLLPRTNGTC